MVVDLGQLGFARHRTAAVSDTRLQHLTAAVVQLQHQHSERGVLL